NAANEVAVARFLAGSLGFADIATLVEKALETNDLPAPQSISDVLEIDRATRMRVDEAMTSVMAS
ncbi:MAG TPA: 1-deoxy-D-xylulose-5-phosphate reductoisomerase, partial [Sphingomicrobium sp.]|nr:1-deoxy-D-xylulose-5-phosphate reductoisomerase [Sphingomicrobium sp.]